MPTVTITPTTYYLSSSTYLSVANASNMYDDTSSGTYATVTNSRTSTTSYYIYLRGFDLSVVPSDAIVQDVAVRVKARHSGGYAQAMYLYDGTGTSLGSSSTTLSTTATTHEINTTHDWADLVAAGSDLGIRINCRRGSRNTTGYVYVYGAEIEVTYQLPVYHDVTVTNTTGATVQVSDAHPLEGDDVIVTASTLSGITVTDNGVNVTSQFIRAQDATVEQVPDATIDTEFSDSGGAFYISSSSSTTDYLEYACGHSAESPGTATSTNTYVKGNASGNTTTGTVIYSFDFSEIPASATIVDVDVRAYCARENSTIDSTHVCRAAVYSGSTLKGAEQDVSGTNYHIHTMSNVGTWTWAELQSATFHFTLGYYGGRIAGITFEVSYELDGYVYTISNVVADHALMFAPASTTALYVKQGSTWAAVQQAYVKRNGSWQAVALDAAFDSTKKYRRGHGSI